MQFIYVPKNNPTAPEGVYLYSNNDSSKANKDASIEVLSKDNKHVFIKKPFYNVIDHEKLLSKNVTCINYIAKSKEYKELQEMKEKAFPCKSLRLTPPAPKGYVKQIMDKNGFKERIKEVFKNEEKQLCEKLKDLAVGMAAILSNFDFSNVYYIVSDAIKESYHQFNTVYLNLDCALNDSNSLRSSDSYAVYKFYTKEKIAKNGMFIIGLPTKLVKPKSKLAPPESKIYLAIIDDSNNHDTDFEYYPCTTREIAVSLLAHAMDNYLCENDVDLSEEGLSHSEVFDIILNELKEDGGVEFCGGIYYRIKELKIHNHLDTSSYISGTPHKIEKVFVTPTPKKDLLYFVHVEETYGGGSSDYHNSFDSEVDAINAIFEVINQKEIEYSGLPLTLDEMITIRQELKEYGEYKHAIEHLWMTFSIKKADEE